MGGHITHQSPFFSRWPAGNEQFHLSPTLDTSPLAYKKGGSKEKEEFLVGTTKALQRHSLSTR